MTRNEMTKLRVAALRHFISELRLASATTSLSAHLAKYRPDQPRVPAGNSDGGQWTLDAMGGAGKPSGSRQAGKWNEINRAKCELQLEKDLFQCRMMLWNPFCEDQAQSRFSACMKDNDIPDFFHVL